MTPTAELGASSADRTDGDGERALERRSDRLRQCCVGGARLVKQHPTVSSEHEKALRPPQRSYPYT